jgi:DNA-binding NarL/FixJ family response regulator
MLILLIEDDLNKIEHLASVVVRELPDATIVRRHSYQSGLDEALRKRPDLIILDMSIPTFDLDRTGQGGRTRPFGGREILRELKRRDMETRVVVVTQFESFGEGAEAMTLLELRHELGDKFDPNYIGTIYYQPAGSDWRGHLARVLRTLGLGDEQ